MCSDRAGSSRLTRRGFLALTGATSATLTAAMYGYSSAPAWASPTFPDDPFTLGVASGDPTPDGVVLWTRLAPDPLAADGLGGMPPRQLPVGWQVATDPRFENVVKAGSATATPELGHSVHVEVAGLLPGRHYYYRFRAGDQLSPVGSTKTAPAAASTPGLRELRARLLPGLDRWTVRRVPHHGRGGPRPGRARRRLRLRATRRREPGGLPGQPRQVQDVHGPAGGARRVSLRHDLRRPRGGEQLGRRDLPARRRGVQRPGPLPEAPRQRLPGLLRAPAAASTATTERSRHAAPPSPRLRAPGVVPCSRHPAVPLRPAHRELPRRSPAPGRRTIRRAR